MSAQVAAPFPLTEDKGENIYAETAPPLDASAIVRKNIEAVDAGLEVQLKSELDTLSITKTLWTFRRTVIICTIAGFSAITDGEYSFTSQRRKNLMLDYRISEYSQWERDSQQGIHCGSCGSRHVSSESYLGFHFWRNAQVRPTLLADISAKRD